MNNLKEVIRQEISPIDRQLLAHVMDDFKKKLENYIQEDGRHLTDIAFKTGLLTGHKTLRRSIDLMGLSDSPLYRVCGAEDDNSAHIRCECEALASLRPTYLGSLFLEPEDINSVNLGAIWSFSKGTSLP